MKDKNIIINGNWVSLLVFLIFLVLKLTKVIDWSWWWVTSPLWIGFAVIFLSLFLFFTVIGIVGILSKIL